MTTNMNEWIGEEIKDLTTDVVNKLPSLKFEEGKIIQFTVDFSKPFQKWKDTTANKKIVKAIIPVTHQGVAKNLWLNVKNPLYREMIHKGNEGQTEFKVIQVGKLADTQYKIVD